MLGWNIGEKIAYCHAGYFNNQEKTAVTQSNKSDYFELLNKNNEVVYSKNIDKVKSGIGEFNVLNFTEFNKTGSYKIKFGDIITNEFVINSNPYLSSLIKSINFLRLLRCGEDIDGVHSACHLNCKTTHENGNTVPNFGGWAKELSNKFFDNRTFLCPCRADAQQCTHDNGECFLHKNVNIKIKFVLESLYTQ